MYKYIIFLSISLLFIGCTSDDTTKIGEENTAVVSVGKTDEANTTTASVTQTEEENITVVPVTETEEENITVTPADNTTITVTTKPEPYLYQQWYLEQNSTFYRRNRINRNAHIHGENVLKHYNGRGVKIAIIDDGLDVNHEDLQGSVFATYDLSTKTGNVYPPNATDYHGTAVSGIIAARKNLKGILGIASGAEIIFLRDKEYMSDSETIELFEKAEAFGADIINCSWGTYNVSDAVRAKIVDLANNGREGKGISIVFATGNDDRNVGNDESSIPEVIAVGATDEENLRAYYSNYGVNLDVMAPGGYFLGMTTLDLMGSSGEATLNENYFLYNDAYGFIGTSAAAPVVSGVIALMLEKNRDLTRSEIESILRKSSDKIGNVKYINGRNNYYGYGKINLDAAMQSF